ncbi:HDOD domain protein [mine drainage metagenome]|jgi:HD-like signal output (HDOD) protein|uniref:HDOD domain protein n=1 Tax=mine drainage metagenome TaxID=410659 RepID=A0A1J5QYN6_9ZZZZ
MSTPPPTTASLAAHQALARRIAEQDMPAFGLTLNQLVSAADSDETSGQQVADIILRDPGLTSRVLRAANAAHLGLAGGARVVTVSRAVVVLGLNPIRSLCVSALAVETMAGASRYAHRVEQALGRALHAAVQVRALALRQQRNREAAERLFVEALLGSIGELALWCFGDDEAELLEQRLAAGEDAEQAEQAVLGCSLRALSKELLHRWKLDALHADSPEVTLAWRLSRTAQQGWDGAPARALTRQVAQLLRQDEAVTLEQLTENAREAAILAQALGVPAHAIPGAAATTADDATSEPDLPEPDLAQQLRALTELGCVATNRRELPLLLEACVEGMHRAVGIDRVAFCLLNPRRDRLLARIVLGLDAGALREALDLAWDPRHEEQLRDQAVLRGDAVVWGDVAAATGADAFLLAGFHLEGNLIGVFYADRAPSRRELDAALIEGFRAFAAQAQLVARALPRHTAPS